MEAASAWRAADVRHGYHYGHMAKVIEHDAQRRSEARRATVLVRMSEQERRALELIAQAKGVPLAEVVREALTPTFTQGMSA